MARNKPGPVVEEKVTLTPEEPSTIRERQDEPLGMLPDGTLNFVEDEEEPTEENE